MKSLTFAFLIVILSNCVFSQTIQTVLNNAGCNTGVTAGLATQLVAKMNQLKPGFMSNLKGLTRINLGSAAAAVPYAQTQTVNAIKKAVAARARVTLTINSALRTLPQQLLLYKWYRLGKCGITLAASPGSSPHESGYGVDISDYSGWMGYMQTYGCSWQGSSDVVHFNCPGTSLGNTSVLAFQRLWNCNNPADTISADGIYGPQTEARVLKSPANGFPKTC
ncbi:peptidoglycan-binding domain 1 [Brachionus plicatilis]|uniref:Peptidoglycan-binding domain 1 n=1 Tax=Brachionus plicatilis TaxID=10195 RepID=A0A3M7PPQ9_BRAPC|nr:peptidoglycan-binding domain 1 [Brachionus plicatilis]